MQRQRGELVPIGEVVADLGGPVKAIREATPQALHHFTSFDQVNQLVSASEADADLGFMARTMALCSLPRTNPGNRLQYKRVNGRVQAHHDGHRGSQAALRQPAAPVDGLGLDRSGTDPKPRVGSRALAFRVHAGAGHIQQRRQPPNPPSQSDAAALSLHGLG